MHRNQIVVFIIWFLLIGIVPLLTGVTDRDSLMIGGVLLAAFLVAIVLWKVANLQMGMRSTWLSKNDHTLAAIVHGVWTGAVLITYLAVGVFVAKQVNIVGDTAEASTISMTAPEPRQKPSKSLAKVNVPLQIVETFYRPPTLQIDVLAPRSQEIKPSDLVVTHGGKNLSVQNVLPTTFEPPLNILVLRDLSASTKAEPFTTFISEATSIVKSLSFERKTAICVVDFAAKCQVALPWTTTFRDAQLQNTKPGDVRQTDLFAALTKAIDSLTTRSGARLLVIIADGGTNIPSRYSPAGLYAYARSKQVTIHAVGLPTEHFQEEFLRKLAERTTGTYLRADTELQQLSTVLSVRDLRPAIRLVVTVPDYNSARPTSVEMIPTDTRF
jgi:hypothetical protein